MVEELDEDSESGFLKKNKQKWGNAKDVKNI